MRIVLSRRRLRVRTAADLQGIDRQRRHLYDVTQNHAKVEGNAKEKMKFPPVPGDTPREKFVNLVRHVFSVGKGSDKKRRTRKRAHDAPASIRRK